MLTELGKFLRKIRIERDEILKDMANKLEVSVAYISAIENGKRAFPEDWKEKIIKLYDFNNERIEEFNKAIINSKESFELSLKEADDAKRDFAYVFARRFNELDEETIAKIKELLGEVEKDE